MGAVAVAVILVGIAFDRSPAGCLAQEFLKVVIHPIDPDPLGRCALRSSQWLSRQFEIF